MVQPTTTTISDKKFVNSYIPNYVPPDLKWYERDGFLTYIDQLKYSGFMSDPDDYLKKATVINFDMVHGQYRSGQQEFSDILSDCLNF